MYPCAHACGRAWKRLRIEITSYRFRETLTVYPVTAVQLCSSWPEAVSATGPQSLPPPGARSTAFTTI